MSEFSAEVLKLDPDEASKRIESAIREALRSDLGRKGVVIGLSGGIDSSVVAALCSRAIGPDRVFGLFLPEADSSGDSLRLGTLLAESLNIRSAVEDITPILAAAGCYQRRDEAIRSAIPEYTSAYKSKIVLPGIEESSYSIFSVVVESPEGVQKRARLSADAYLGIVAATNFKQRTRKMMEYFWADRLCYAVAGTPNRLEYDQGFFVKNGDGSADLKPIAHLYKSQVYQLAAYLSIPEEIQRRPPTTDTYSLEQSQEEFYFRLPYPQMDLCLYAMNHGVAAAEAAPAAGLTESQVECVYKLIASKRRATRYLHQSPVLVEEIFGKELTGSQFLGERAEMFVRAERV
jgi:NAD+ synthase